MMLNGDEKSYVKRLSVRRLNRILTMLFADMKDLTDEGKDFSVHWNIMHMYSSSQLAKLLAMHRGIEPELAGIAAALHDIGIVMTKKLEGHAEAAEREVYDFLKKYNLKWGRKPLQVTEEEVEKVVKAIVQHNEKGVFTSDPFVELLKDVDSLDGYLHGVTPEGARVERCQRVIEELGITAWNFEESKEELKIDNEK